LLKNTLLTYCKVWWSAPRSA